MKFKESYGKISSDRSFDKEYWQSLGPAAIFDAAFGIIKDYLIIRHNDDNEPRLQRSVESFKKA